MALLKLPVTSAYPHYEFKAELDSIRYGFVLRWNTRANRWMLDIKLSNDTVLLSGIPLVMGVDLLARFQSNDIPQGNLFLLNLEDENAECDRNDLGKNVLLMYQEAL